MYSIDANIIKRHMDGKKSKGEEREDKLQKRKRNCFITRSIEIDFLQVLCI